MLLDSAGANAIEGGGGGGEPAKSLDNRSHGQSRVGQSVGNYDRCRGGDGDAADVDASHDAMHREIALAQAAGKLEKAEAQGQGAGNAVIRAKTASTTCLAWNDFLRATVSGAAVAKITSMFRIWVSVSHRDRIRKSTLFPAATQENQHAYAPGLMKRMIHMVAAPTRADAGMVRTQAQTMRRATPQRTADRRVVAPTATMAPVMV